MLHPLLRKWALMCLLAVGLLLPAQAQNNVNLSLYPLGSVPPTVELHTADCTFPYINFIFNSGFSYNLGSNQRAVLQLRKFTTVVDSATFEPGTTINPNRFKYPSSQGNYNARLIIYTTQNGVESVTDEYMSQTMSISTSSLDANFNIDGQWSNISISLADPLLINAKAAHCEDRYRLGINGNYTDWVEGENAPEDFSLFDLAGLVNVLIKGGQQYDINLEIGNGASTDVKTKQVTVVVTPNTFDADLEFGDVLDTADCASESMYFYATYVRSGSEAGRDQEIYTWRLYKGTQLVWVEGKTKDPEKKVKTRYTKNIQYPTSPGIYTVTFEILGKNFYEENFQVVALAQGNPLRIVASPAPIAAGQINNTPNPVICEGDSIVFDASASYCYDRYSLGLDWAWGTEVIGERMPDNVDIRQLASELGVPLVPGQTYTFRYAIGNGGPAVHNALDFVYAVNQTPVFTSAPQDVCVGQSYTVSVTDIPGATYQWTIPGNYTVLNTPNGFTRVIEANMVGILPISVAVGNICTPVTLSGPTITSNNAPNAGLSSISGASDFCPFQSASYSVFIQNAEQYEWEFTNGLYNTDPANTNGPNVTVQSLLNSTTGTIRVRGINGCGVSAWVETTVTVTGNCSQPCETNVRQAAPSQSLQGLNIVLGPNPVHLGQEVQLSMGVNTEVQPCIENRLAPPALAGITQISIVNMLGQPVLSLDPNQVGNGQISFTTKGFDPGVHLVRIVTDQGTFVRRFMVLE